MWYTYINQWFSTIVVTQRSLNNKNIEGTMGLRWNLDRDQWNELEITLGIQICVPGRKRTGLGNSVKWLTPTWTHTNRLSPDVYKVVIISIPLERVEAFRQKYGGIQLLRQAWKIFEVDSFHVGFKSVSEKLEGTSAIIMSDIVSLWMSVRCHRPMPIFAFLWR